MTERGHLNARERMLSRLREACPASASWDDEAAALSKRIDAHYASRHAARDEAGVSANVPVGSALTAQFQAALEAAHALVWRADAVSWPALLANRLRDAGVRRLLLDPGRTEGKQLLHALPGSIEPVSYARPLEQWKAELFETIEAGFTVARSGIAATGTLILAPDRGTPRTVSLVPPLHIALVYASRLHRDAYTAMVTEQWRADMPTNLVLVSGPSKTSDIQQTLAYGAHGPRQLWVVIVEETGLSQRDNS